ncbi:hypothetical protein EXIGLDRAFT_735961 [Exidia glandulosa HHB12029]|uniref:Uncharacterized protein n=1 Tax=Exidia glandulosa HHB12029 TaxID=1314781 RepID=A0A166NCP7_EXIGL|nr:hypothetical protein EXIGLDRAFT_735961 [Exidia glandulosa HHB12029]
MSVHCAQSACTRVAVKKPVVEHCDVVLDWMGCTPIVHQITSQRQTVYMPPDSERCC